MADFRLHERVQKGLVRLARADQPAVAELYEQVKASTPAFVSAEFANDLVRKTKHWNRASLDEIFPALVSLCLIRAKEANSVTAFVDMAMEALAKFPAEGVDKLDQDIGAVLKERLGLFLSLQSLDISAKAYEVLTAHQRAFLESRIFSDIRSIFHDDVTKGPVAAVIVHKLKLEYRQDNKTREVFFALDSKDLKTLADVIKRAQEKDEALRRTLLTSNVAFVEPQ